MKEFVTVTATTTAGLYEEMLPQLRGLLEGESDVVANLGNAAAILKMTFEKISWAGFYLLRGDTLVLGPFQGKPACVRIRPGEGVCGTAFARKATMIVPDVLAFPGHIVCDPDSRSEIVVPLLNGADCVGVLDLDSNTPSAFDEEDARFLVRIADLVAPFVRKG